MTDLERILPLWRELDAAAADYVLATVVAVEGSSYRKPGACMLLAPDGRRAGTVSGGCLEAQVASRAWWHTTSGPTIQRYSTVEEDGDMPYGSGCGGVVYLLLERRATAGPMLHALDRAFNLRMPWAVATVLDGSQIGRRAFAGLERAPSESHQASSELVARLQCLAERALSAGESIEEKVANEGEETRVWANHRAARPGLWIFGAGDDGKPLLSLAKELGWFVSVADGRSHLATRERFAQADAVTALQIAELPASAPGPAFAAIQAQDAAVILTHSFEQDSRILASLLALDHPLAYIGVLGPQRRTRELLVEVARLLSVPASPASAHEEWIERWLAQLHAPMGLDLAAESPETIAFSIVAEIQQTLGAATALPLREVRSAAHSVHG
jgi:xanthine/CO dehydrogenase XdhC/CoxF family maturation factor